MRQADAVSSGQMYRLAVSDNPVWWESGMAMGLCRLYFFRPGCRGLVCRGFAQENVVRLIHINLESEENLCWTCC